MIKYLSKIQVDKLLNIITDPRDKALITLMYFYGLRRGEVCNLLITDIDCANNLIHIKPLKGGIEGNHYLTNDCINRINEYLVIRKKQPNKLPYLFVSKQKPTKLDGSTVYRIYCKYASLAGFPKELHNPHTLRHTLGCGLISSGFDLGFVKDLLRHRNISSTTVYANIMNQAKLAMQKNALENGIFIGKIA